ncbi:MULTISPECIES: winged helix-turn-helix domain-containing protein [unclassified Winogradskyella]|uniref:winged helix-turn-helix domain-containing protein n=1 Tax=unclassified Winogradskyella TaxID=2615021 RepID=UPI000B3C441F|nr:MULTISPECIES: winged helix-turn-helix domain-containing protein [unclassified Winogradskyella]RZN83773.1 MAG: winged helix family transcriptional regulator [Winogradskyella sp.]
MKSLINYTVICFLFLIFSCSNNEYEELEETVKISMREVGNQLLLANQDSTSLVLPIKAITPLKYRLSFQKNLSFSPDSLVTIIRKNFEKSELPNHYRVEVLQCKDDEVAYSYQMSANEDKTIIPCISRELPFECYYIEARFIKDSASTFSREIIVFIFGFITIGFVAFGIFKMKKTSEKRIEENFIAIGKYKFYEIHNKLIKEAEEITLSKKECELLAILVASPNQIVTRDELTKRVWEDNGVIVGRSLDTFISKLRKKLKEDDSVIIENVHGIGYKLVISQ